MRVCPTCNGRGRCTRCGGSGKTGIIPEICPTCRGVKVCITCKGKGRK
jgi:hypothetical protein